MYVGFACGCGCEGGGQRHRLRDTARQRTTQCVCVCVYTCAHRVGGVWPVCGLWGQGVCGYACGVWAETEAERHSQAKDNTVCVCVYVWLVCRAMCVRGCVWCV